MEHFSLNERGLGSLASGCWMKLSGVLIPSANNLCSWQAMMIFCLCLVMSMFSYVQKWSILNNHFILCLLLYPIVTSYWRCSHWICDILYGHIRKHFGQGHERPTLKGLINNTLDVEFLTELFLCVHRLILLAWFLASSLSLMCRLRLKLTLSLCCCSMIVCFTSTDTTC